MGKHCVVIGAGIVGASCAWHLQRKGIQVTVIDPELPGQSCSFGNAACISVSGIVPFSHPGMIRKVPAWLVDPVGPVRIRPGDFPALIPWLWRFWRVSSIAKVERIAAAQALLMKTVFADYDDILQATDCAHLERASGAIHLYDSEKEYRADQWEVDLRARYGFEQHRLGEAELKSLVPCLNPGKGVAIMTPDWHQLLDPARVTAGIAKDCFSNGGAWMQDRVSSVNAGSYGVSLQTVSGRQIEADQLVVAAGAWSNHIAKQLDFPVPMVAKRGYHSQVSDPGIQLGLPVMSMSRFFVMTPLTTGLRIAGTAEFAALDAKPDFRRAKALLKQAGRYLEGLKTEGATEWMGQRPMMADSTPVISESPAHPNVFYAFGHGHYGLTQGPTTGRIIADMVLANKPSIDLSPFRFDRFKTPEPD